MRAQRNKLAPAGAAAFGNYLLNALWAPLWLGRSLLRCLRRSLMLPRAKAG